MKINITLPFDLDAPPEEFWTLDAVKEVGATLDAAGYNAGLVTDHPVPTARWLDSGGHFAQSPMVMLSLLAAHTTRLRLQTGILVLPYRNPFIVARDAATLDRFSNGRLTLSMAVGYLKGEYRALGVNFDDRFDLMEEYLQALDAALSKEEFEFEGKNFTAFGNRIVPMGVQKPRVPFYVGGNSKRAIRWVVDYADGWNPYFTPKMDGQPGNVTTTRTKAMEGEEDLKRGLEYMHEYCEKVGRKTPPELVLGGLTSTGEQLSAQQLIDLISRYKEIGASTVAVSMRAKTRGEWCENAARIGEEVVAKFQ